MSDRNLAATYRPRKFHEVLGQPEAVAILSGLILAGRVGRDLLLKGAFGSGKTTLARIYANALSCHHLEPDGSPCGSCAGCGGYKTEGALIEYDVPGRGGMLENVIEFLGEHLKYARDTRVFFFDEAHALERRAQDYLLKQIEEAPERFRYIFATTEPLKLRQSLRSRLLTIEVFPLNPAESVYLLKGTADRENIAYEPEALRVLAAVKKGHPRDLLIGLEHVKATAPGGLVTSSHVRRLFGVDHAEVLATFFKSLARGDLESQLTALRNWRRSAGEKSTWIESFLMSLYYNDVLGATMAVDPLVDTMKEDRAEIIAAFRAHFVPDDALALERLWRKLIGYWESLRPATTDAGLVLNLTLLHEQLKKDRTEAKFEGPPVEDATRLEPFEDELESLREEDFRFEHARGIINRASYFIQEYGLVFDAKVTITPFLDREGPEGEAHELVTRFFRDLEDKVMAECEIAHPFAGLCLLTRDDFGKVAGKIIAHIDQSIDLEPWIRSWQISHQIDDKSVELARVPEKNLKSHWQMSLELCEGLASEESVITQGWEADVELRRQLKLKKEQTSGPIRGGLVLVSRRLRRPALAEAEQPKLPFLSAFDDRAWGFLQKGWERSEWRDRRDEKIQRISTLKEIEVSYRDDPEALRRRQNELMQSWPSDAKRRRRSWSPRWW